ncbi:MAG: hypothetical protein PHW29_04410 [Flavobacterium sp.]|nr:hypothetical protein [Flavobacterium sp.]
MSKKSKQKLIIFISQQGECGKSHCSTNTIDQLRKQGHQCAGYLLDIRADKTLNRLGERDEDGLLLTEQNPLKGIQTIDIANQNNGDFDYQESEKHKLFNAFEANVDYSVFDFPAQGDTTFTSHFKAGELEGVLELSDKEIIVVIPVINTKSLDSLISLKKTFTFVNSSINDDIKFYVVHNPVSKETELSFAKYKQTIQHQEMLELGDRYKCFNLQNINKSVLEAVKDKPYSYYLDENFKLIQDRLPKEVTSGGIPKAEFMIQIRNIICNDTGFANIVKEYFV